MGRHKKEVLNDEQMEELIIQKYLAFEPMTLEEASYALWMAEGKKTKAPMTKMGFLKLERKVLTKIRSSLAKFGIKQFDDVFDICKSHRNAKQNKFDAPEEE